MPGEIAWRSCCTQSNGRPGPPWSGWSAIATSCSAGASIRWSPAAWRWLSEPVEGGRQSRARALGTLPSDVSATTAPDDIVQTHAHAAANRREPLLVLDPLIEFLEEHDLQAPPELEATPIGDGHSNVTFALSTGVVLRRPPRGPLPPSAHDVLREARLLRALETTPVRAPGVLAVCEDPQVIGAPFYVMERIEGDAITNSIRDALDNPTERRRIADELIDALVALHAVQFAEIGLEGFGRPTGYLERQLRRFNGLWEHNRTRAVPEFEQVGEWLAANLPESPPATIVHGDYRLGNTMFAPTAPARLTAILDWEMATIGDPFADLGYMMIHWMQALDWYVALALWKAAVFMEGNYKRAVSGATDDPYLKTFGEGVVELAQRALAVTQHGF